jgi:hypothetical protein
MIHFDSLYLRISIFTANDFYLLQLDVKAGSYILSFQRQSTSASLRVIQIAIKLPF